MTGWSDTWMLSRYAKHPNCMLKWMAWMVTPEVQAQVAEYFGEAPANPKACDILDKGYGSYAIPNFCDAYHVTDQAFYQRDQLLEDAAPRLRRQPRERRASPTTSGSRPTRT